VRFGVDNFEPVCS